MYFDRKKDIDLLQENKDFNKKTFFLHNSEYYSIFSLGFNISNKCNLSCSYCFMRDKTIAECVDVKETEKVIEKFLLTHPNCKRLFIDLSGCGEPLLSFDTIISIADIVNVIKGKYESEIIVNFICNGTLLSETKVKALQDKNVLFGVSVDGGAINHNNKRIMKNGAPTYEMLRNNILKIEDRHLFGVTMTLDNTFCGEIKESYLEMSKLAPTYSIKLCRNASSSYSKDLLNSILCGYDEFTDFIIDQLLHEDFSLFSGFLNGDDSFMKILSRVFSGLKADFPCEGLLARFTYSKGSYYPCAPASAENWFRVNDINEMNYEFHQLSLNHKSCNECFAKPFCGGECPIVLKKFGNVDNFNCEIKRNFVKNSIKIVSMLINEPDIYVEVQKMIYDRIKRNI